MYGVPFTPEVLSFTALHYGAAWGDPVTLRFRMRQHLRLEAKFFLVFVLDYDVFFQLQDLQKVVCYGQKMSTKSVNVQTWLLTPSDS